MRTTFICLHERIIAITNEDRPLVVGKIVKFENFGETPIPIVENEQSKEQTIHFGPIFPYSEKLLSFLNSFSDYKERWEIVRKIVVICAERRLVEERKLKFDNNNTER